MNSPDPLDSLFSPGGIVLIGAAHTEEKLGGVILRNLLRYGKPIYPVTPTHEELMGIRAFRSVQAVKEHCDARCAPVDLSIIVRPAPEVPGILRELQHWTKTAIIVSAGFSEAGHPELQDEIRKIGKETGIRLLGPNCLGVYNAHKKLDTFFFSHERFKRPKKGNVAMLSQSGAVMTSLLEAMRASNTGVSKAIGYGNAVDINESDIFSYFGRDKHTDIVISYIESLDDGRKFIKAATDLSKKKTLLILKSGKGFSGQAAAFSHTGRLAGRYEVFSSVLRQFGIKEALNFDDLADAAKAISYQSKKGDRLLFEESKSSLSPFLRKVCIITNGGGSGVLAADECMKLMLDVAEVPDEKKEKLRETFPPFYAMNNPIDLTAQVKDTDYGAVLETLKDDYDGFIIMALTAVAGITPALSGVIKDFKEKSNKHVVLHTDNNSIGRSITALCEKAGIPVYPSPERAARGLNALLSL